MVGRCPGSTRDGVADLGCDLGSDLELVYNVMRRYFLGEGDSSSMHSGKKMNTVFVLGCGSREGRAYYQAK